MRIALKKLRYAAEFFEASIGKKRTKPYLAALKELQDALGHLNDVAVAERLIGGLIDAPGRAATRRPRVGRRHGAGLARPWRGRDRAADGAAWQAFRRAQAVLA